jgi:uncharacterized membrane protein YesL
MGEGVGDSMWVTIDGIKKGFSVFWGDSIILIVLNFICFLSLLPAMLFFSVTSADGTLLTTLINVLLLLPFVFFLFALYYLLYDCGQSIAIRFGTYFRYLRQTWKQAMIFGLINILMIFLIFWNLSFYAQFEAGWANVFQMIFVSISVIWFVLQLVMLPLYPRLEEPGFRLALRNSVAIFGRYVIPVLVVVFDTVLIGVLTLRFQAIGMIFSIVLAASLAEGVVGEIVLDVKGTRQQTDDLDE